jgi:formylglycine-generating enzyme
MCRSSRIAEAGSPRGCPPRWMMRKIPWMLGFVGAWAIACSQEIRLIDPASTGEQDAGSDASAGGAAGAAGADGGAEAASEVETGGTSGNGGMGGDDAGDAAESGTGGSDGGCPALTPDLCNGVCVDKYKSLTNCGACGNVCESDRECRDGSCRCSFQPDDCKGTCMNFSNDLDNCGACEHKCATGETCSQGVCCPPSKPTVCNGQCVDTSADPENCGNCGTKCSAATSCTWGYCKCPAETPDECDGKCVDVSNDAHYCGACYSTIPIGGACYSGVGMCVPAAPDNCNGVCVDTESDDANCGACGHSCKDSENCQAGACVSCGSACCGCGPLEQCWNGQNCVAKLVPVPGGFSIDATEVTQNQYAAWLATSPSTSGQPASCSFNTDFTPSYPTWPDPTYGHHPVVYVDWCDAYAYCKAVGKRLCGKIGGGALPYGDYGDVSKSQWYRACSSGGVRNYPYGGDPSVSTTDGYDGGACGGDDAYWGMERDVAILAGCQSSVAGYEGIHDLSGNVWEWEDSCATESGGTDLCRERGGSGRDHVLPMRCLGGLSYAAPRSATWDLTGFRCCSAP